MTCDECQRRMDYCFYIDNEHWRKVVGEERYAKNQGRICAHCTLQRLGGIGWEIVWREPCEEVRNNFRKEFRTNV